MPRKWTLVCSSVASSLSSSLIVDLLRIRVKYLLLEWKMIGEWDKIWHNEITSVYDSVGYIVLFVDCFKTAYVVPSVTVYVTIPVLNTTVPLNSIFPWAIIMSRIDTNFPLSQTFQVYKDGFGNPTSNFWLGLTRTYYVTNSAVNGGRTYRLRFELLSAENSM